MHTHGGDRHHAAQRAGCSPAEILDFSATINPLGPPPGVLDAARAALSEATHYPHAEPLRAALAARLGLDVVIGNGATELLYAAMIGTRHVWAPSPSRLGYATAAKAAGAHLVGDMFGADVLIFGRPNDPDGHIPDADEIVEIARAWPACRVVVDESFLALTDAASCLAAEPPPNLWVVTSMSNAYAIPGLRLGWIAGQDVSAVRAYLPPGTVSTPALAAGQVCLERDDWVRGCARQLAGWRDALREGLSALPGVEAVTGSANLLLVTLRTARADAVCRALVAQDRILIRDASGFRGLGEQHVRVAVRRPEDNARLIQALGTVV